MALLSGALSVSQTVNTAAARAPNLNGLSSSLSTVENDLGALAPAIGTVVGAPSQAESIATVNGGSFAITSPVLAIADQLLLAYSTQFVTQVQAQPGSAAPCPAPTGNAATDAIVCQMQQSAQQAVLGSTTTTQAGAGMLLSGALLPLAGWAAEGNASGGNAALAAGAYQLALNIIVPIVAAYGASDPPAFSQSLAIAGPGLATSLTGGPSGLAVLPGTIDALSTYPAAAALASGAVDPGPQGGLIIGPPYITASITGGIALPVQNLPTLPTARASRLQVARQPSHPVPRPCKSRSMGKGQFQVLA